ncbi:MAG: deoxynucleoside kinase [Anaerolineales bacterium]|nr:deoxynucleoside kinase [Chloroflexota bacterium]MBL6980850.1 deoxynucleoside kinase [Anaerolineales bacterium]
MYIAIEGVIGVGKTTLARLLQPAFEAKLFLEVFEENPFLADFYTDRARYAFQTQIFFLLSRYHQQKAIAKELDPTKNVVADYTFKKDALFAGINLENDELTTYHQVHNALAEKISLPDLIVYLRATSDVLMQRIAHRDRHYERDMDSGYIDELNHAYENFFGDGYNGPKILAIDTNNLNFVASKEDLKQVENRIRQSLQMTPFQTELPLDLKGDD